LSLLFPAPQTTQGSSGLEYVIIIPVAAIILVPTAIAVKRSKRKTPKPERKTKENKTPNTTNANKEAKQPIKNTQPIKSSPLINPKETLRSTVTNKELNPKQNTNSLEQKRSTISCDYHLGYLRDLPKNIKIPDECYVCTKLIECKRKT
jgi:hypothetical protein